MAMAFEPFTYSAISGSFVVQYLLLRFVEFILRFIDFIEFFSSPPLCCHDFWCRGAEEFTTAQKGDLYFMSVV